MDLRIFANYQQNLFEFSFESHYGLLCDTICKQDDWCVRFIWQKKVSSTTDSAILTAFASSKKPGRAIRHNGYEAFACWESEFKMQGGGLVETGVGRGGEEYYGRVFGELVSCSVECGCVERVPDALDCKWMRVSVSRDHAHFSGHDIREIS